MWPGNNRIPSASFRSVQIMPPLAVDCVKRQERIDIRRPCQPREIFLRAVVRWIIGEALLTQCSLTLTKEYLDRVESRTLDDKNEDGEMALLE